MTWYVAESIWGEHRALLYRCEHDENPAEFSAPPDGGYVMLRGGQVAETSLPRNPKAMLSWDPRRGNLAERISQRYEDEGERRFDILFREPACAECVRRGTR